MQQSTDQAVSEFLQQNSQWSLKDNKLHREYRFPDFTRAFGFMTMVAVVAEKTNHHPEWFNVYSKVVVDLTTHEANGISERDFTLAVTMDELAARL